MPLYPKNRTKQYPVATEGRHAAVLGAVQNLGLVLTDYGEKEKVRFIWLLDEIDQTTGEPLLAMQSMTNSSNGSATLFKVVKDFAGIEIDEHTDLETLVGSQALLTIAHNRNPRTGRIYANVLLPVAKAPKGQSVEIPVSWCAPKVRRQASESGSESGFGSQLVPAAPRKPAPSQLQTPYNDTRPEIGDDDIPF
jgi:hypothetical protein